MSTPSTEPPSAREKELLERIRRKDDLLTKRKAREKATRAERNAMRERMYDMEARAVAAEAHVATLRKDLMHQQALADAQLCRPGLPPAHSDTTRRMQGWLHRWLAHRVWRCEMRLGVLNQHPPRAMEPERQPDLKPPDGQWPSISIVTPSRNQAAFLKRTMRSVLDQGYPGLEYVVMDGGSTDGSKEILEAHASRLSYWQSAPDGGLCQAIAGGFAKTSGEIMAWLNSDDVLLPGVLHHVGAYFAQHPEIDAVYGHRVLLNEHDQQIGSWVLPPHDNTFTRWVDYVPQETLFWRRRAFERAGGMDISFRFAVDWDLILRLQRTGAVIKRLPYFLGGFRVHAEQKSQTEIQTIGYDECQRLRQSELGEAFNEAELAMKVVRFQALARWYNFLLRFGLRR